MIRIEHRPWEESSLWKEPFVLKLSPPWEGSRSLSIDFSKLKVDGNDYYLPGKSTVSMELIHEILGRLSWNASFDTGELVLTLDAHDSAAENVLKAIHAFNYGYGAHKILRKSLPRLKAMTTEELATHLCSRLVV